MLESSTIPLTLGYGPATEVAQHRGAASLARLPRGEPAALRRDRGPAAARLGYAAQLLRDLGAAVRGTEPCPADERVGGGVHLEQEPYLACSGTPRGTRLGPPGRLSDRPPWPGRAADGQRVRCSRGDRSGPRGVRPIVAVR